MNIPPRALNTKADIRHQTQHFWNSPLMSLALQKRLIFMNQ